MFAKKQPTFDLEKRVYKPGVLRHLPFGWGFVVQEPAYKLQFSHEAAIKTAALHNGETNKTGRHIETVVVIHKETGGGKERR